MFREFLRPKSSLPQESSTDNASERRSSRRNFLSSPVQKFLTPEVNQLTDQQIERDAKFPAREYIIRRIVEANNKTPEDLKVTPLQKKDTQEYKNELDWETEIDRRTMLQLMLFTQTVLGLTIGPAIALYNIEIIEERITPYEFLLNFLNFPDVPCAADTNKAYYDKKSIQNTFALIVGDSNARGFADFEQAPNNINPVAKTYIERANFMFEEYDAHWWGMILAQNSASTEELFSQIHSSLFQWILGNETPEITQVDLNSYQTNDQSAPLVFYTGTHEQELVSLIKSGISNYNQEVQQEEDVQQIDLESLKYPDVLESNNFYPFSMDRNQDNEILKEKLQSIENIDVHVSIGGNDLNKLTLIEYYFQLFNEIRTGNPNKDNVTKLMKGINEREQVVEDNFYLFLKEMHMLNAITRGKMKRMFITGTPNVPLDKLETFIMETPLFETPRDRKRIKSNVKRKKYEGIEIPDSDLINFFAHLLPIAVDRRKRIAYNRFVKELEDMGETPNFTTCFEPMDVSSLLYVFSHVLAPGQKQLAVEFMKRSFFEGKDFDEIYREKARIAG